MRRVEYLYRARDGVPGRRAPGTTRGKRWGALGGDTGVLEKSKAGCLRG